VEFLFKFNMFRDVVVCKTKCFQNWVFKSKIRTILKIQIINCLLRDYVNKIVELLPVESLSFEDPPCFSSAYTNTDRLATSVS
jgi:hypothetical protein